MSTEHQSQLRKHDQIDKQVPAEVWQNIFNRLYPSQLSRMSMVNNNFNKIVSSLSVWSSMFSVTFRPTTRLRTLRNMPESKSYMVYMCASSLYICEQCLGLAPFNDHWRKWELPQSFRAPSPTMAKGNVKYLGEEVNLHWTIRMCNSCRQKQRSINEVGDDQKTKDRIQWYREQL